MHLSLIYQVTLSVLVLVLLTWFPNADVEAKGIGPSVVIGIMLHGSLRFLITPRSSPGNITGGTAQAGLELRGLGCASVLFYLFILAL